MWDIIGKSILSGSATFILSILFGAGTTIGVAGMLRFLRINLRAHLGPENKPNS